MKGMLMSRFALTLGAAMLALVVGCSQQEPAATSAAPAGPSAEGQKFVLASPPENAQEVIAAREHAQADEEIVVVGRIGGSTQPWVEGLAAFSIVDNSLKACSDIPGDKCPTPWDYCCEADLPKANLLVKFVGDDGRVVATDARALLGVSELQTVYVRGKAQRDEAGNLTVLASNIYVAPASAASTADHHDHAHAHDHAHEHSVDGHEHAHEHAGGHSATTAAPPAGETP
jgi:hypothetical protein